VCSELAFAVELCVLQRIGDSLSKLSCLQRIRDSLSKLCCLQWNCDSLPKLSCLQRICDCLPKLSCLQRFVIRCRSCLVCSGSVMPLPKLYFLQRICDVAVKVVLSAPDMWCRCQSCIVCNGSVIRYRSCVVLMWTLWSHGHTTHTQRHQFSESQVNQVW
jgi:hypothetical protein